MEDQKLVYALTKVNGELCIEIGFGKFKDFSVKIINLRIDVKDDNGYKSISEVKDDDEVELLFEYDLTLVPDSYIMEETDQEDFEVVLNAIIIDILSNHPELYGVENEVASNSKVVNQ